MRTILLFAVLVSLGTAASAADRATCDAKPFTLNKPAPAAQKVPPAPKLADATPAKPAEKTKPTPKPKSKSSLLGDCNAKTKKPA
jgi:hypothetical protein